MSSTEKQTGQEHAATIEDRILRYDKQAFKVRMRRIARKSAETASTEVGGTTELDLSLDSSGS